MEIFSSFTSLTDILQEVYCDLWLTDKENQQIFKNGWKFWKCETLVWKSSKHAGSKTGNINDRLFYCKLILDASMLIRLKQIQKLNIFNQTFLWLSYKCYMLNTLLSPLHWKPSVHCVIFDHNACFCTWIEFFCHKNIVKKVHFLAVERTFIWSI